MTNSDEANEKQRIEQCCTNTSGTLICYSFIRSFMCNTCNVSGLSESSFCACMTTAPGQNVQNRSRPPTHPEAQTLNPTLNPKP